MNIFSISYKLIKLIKNNPHKSIQQRFPKHKFGRGTYGKLVLQQWNENAKLQMGNFCSIAADVQIFLGGEHRPDWVTTYPFNILWPSAKEFIGHPRSKGDVVIGHDVWIGTEAIILSGVVIGNGSVIGARAVVSKSVPPYAVVVGNPAQVIRYRFDERTIERLQKIEWWNWSDETINHAMSDLLSNNISCFLENAENEKYFKNKDSG